MVPQEDRQPHLSFRGTGREASSKPSHDGLVPHNASESEPRDSSSPPTIPEGQMGSCGLGGVWKVAVKYMLSSPGF